MNKAKNYLQRIRKKTEEIRNSKYAIPVYIFTIFIVSIWTIFMPCVSYILLPILAVYIPYRFFGEKGLKKIAIAGLIAVFLVSLTATAYNTHYFYSQDIESVDSEDGFLEEGRLNRLYGDTDEPFNFTVKLNEYMIEGNFSVYLNITYTQWFAGGSEIVNDTYKMKRLNSSSTEEGSVYYKELDLGEKRYFHRFSVNYKKDEEDNWDETKEIYGPMTLPLDITLFSVFIQRTPLPILVYLFIMSILWWRKKMKDSRRKSTEGLNEKEEELEDTCPECGGLLKGSTKCPQCGHKIKEVKKKKRISCSNCGKMVSTDQEECPYCGEDIEVANSDKGAMD